MPSFSEIAKMDVKELGALMSGGLGSVKLGSGSSGSGSGSGGSGGGVGGGRLTSKLRRSTAGGTLVGLDVQPGYLAAVEAEVNGSIRIKRACGAWLPPDTIREGEIIDDHLLAETLREMFKSGMNKRVRVGLANQRTVLRMMELPPISDRKDIEAAIAFQAQEQIPMPVNNTVIDFYPLGIVDTPAGRRQRVIVVAAQRDMVSRLVAAVTAAGLKPVAVDLSAFALIRALYRPAGQLAGDGAPAGLDAPTVDLGGGSERETDSVAGQAGVEGPGSADGPGDGGQAERAGSQLEIPAEPGGGEAPPRVLYLNIGGLTNLAIGQEKICRFTRTVGSGLESMAAVLAERQSVPVTEAREALAAVALSEESASAGDQGDRLAAEAAATVSSGIAEIAREVRNSIDFHRAQDGGGEIDVVLAGGPAFEIDGFAPALESALGMRLQRRTVSNGLGEVHGVPAERLTVAAGLAIEEAP